MFPSLSGLGETLNWKTPGVEVMVAVMVAVGVMVRVAVKVAVDMVPVGVWVTVLVTVGVNVWVGKVPVAVTVGVEVTVEVGVRVGVFVIVAVKVGLKTTVGAGTDWAIKNPGISRIANKNFLKSASSLIEFTDDRGSHFGAGNRLLAFFRQIRRAQSFVQYGFDG